MNNNEIEFLEKLKNHLGSIDESNYKKNIKYISSGICYLVSNFCNDSLVHYDTYMKITRILSNMHSSHELFSGYQSHPIPHPSWHAITAFYKCKDLWDPSTIYGQNRWKFLRHDIKCLEDIIQRMRNNKDLTLKEVSENMYLY